MMWPEWNSQSTFRYRGRDVLGIGDQGSRVNTATLVMVGSSLSCLGTVTESTKCLSAMARNRWLVQ
mgnify:CR=1 FL=1